MASGRAPDLEQAMVLFRRAFERVPDNTIEKSA
jgi:hypothetical protein